MRALLQRVSTAKVTIAGETVGADGAARPEVAIPLYEGFLRQMEAALGKPVAAGRFGADMEVSLVNDGPVTLMVESKG